MVRARENYPLRRPVQTLGPIDVGRTIDEGSVLLDTIPDTTAKELVHGIVRADDPVFLVPERLGDLCEVNRELNV